MRCELCVGKIQISSNLLNLVNSEGAHQVIAEKLVNDKDPFAQQYKTSVRQIMDKGASKFTTGKRLRLTSDANNYDLHVLPETLSDAGVTHTIIYFGIPTS